LYTRQPLEKQPEPLKLEVDGQSEANGLYMPSEKLACDTGGAFTSMPCGTSTSCMSDVSRAFTEESTCQPQSPELIEMLEELHDHLKTSLSVPDPANLSFTRAETDQSVLSTYEFDTTSSTTAAVLCSLTPLTAGSGNSEDATALCDEEKEKATLTGSSGDGQPHSRRSTAFLVLVIASILVLAAIRRRRL